MECIVTRKSRRVSERRRRSSTPRVEQEDNCNEKSADGGFPARLTAVEKEVAEENLAELAALLADGLDGNAASDSEDYEAIDRELGFSTTLCPLLMQPICASSKEMLAPQLPPRQTTF